MNGFFITFEGPDGAGKTTQIKALGEKLEEMGWQVVYTREPGGTRLSEVIRGMLLNPENSEMTNRTEALLYAAARAQHVDELIRPALNEGKVVLCDRFTDSTVAYQGHGRGIDIKLLEDLNGIAVEGTWPDLTIILDLEPAVGLERISQKRAALKGEGKDRIEQEALEFHLQVRRGFLKLAEENPQRYKMIDANQHLDTVSQEIFRVVKEVLGNVNP